MRKISLVVGLLFVVLLAWQFMSLVTPAAARELKAACAGMQPAPNNEMFPKGFPTPVPNFSAQAQNGEMVSMHSFKGKVTLVNFWASWCTVCKSEKPSLIDLVQDMSDDIEIITVASEKDWSEIQKLFPQGPPFTVLLDPPREGEGNLGPVSRSFGITAVPESFLVDKAGNIRYYFINKRNWNASITRTCLRSVINE